MVDYIAQWSDQKGGGRDFTAMAGERPVLIAAGPNDRLAADFDGVDDFMTTGLDLSTFINADTGYMIISLMVDTATLNESDVHDDHMLLGSSDRSWGLFISSNDTLTIVGVNDAAVVSKHPRAFATPIVVSLRHQVGNLYLRVNNGTDVTVASGDTADLTGDLQLAKSTTGTEADIKVWEVVMFDCIPVLGVRDSVERNMMHWVGAVRDPAEITGWSPLSNPNLLAWYPFDQATGLDGDPISTFHDYSENGNELSIAGFANAPTLVISDQNGLNVTRYDTSSGSGFVSTNSFYSGKAAGTAYILFKNANAEPTSSSLWDFGTSSFSNHWPLTDGECWDDFGSTVRYDLGNPSQTFNTTYRLLTIYSAHNDWAVRIDGGTYVAGAPQPFYATGANTVAWNTLHQIGRDSGLGHTGWIAECFFTGAKDSLINQQSAEGYLMWKWGVQSQLDPAHPFASAPP